MSIRLDEYFIDCWSFDILLGGVAKDEPVIVKIDSSSSAHTQHPTHGLLDYRSEINV